MMAVPAHDISSLLPLKSVRRKGGMEANMTPVKMLSLIYELGEVAELCVAQHAVIHTRIIQISFRQQS